MLETVIGEFPKSLLSQKFAVINTHARAEVATFELLHFSCSQEFQDVRSLQWKQRKQGVRGEPSR